MLYFSPRACANNGSWSTVRSGLPTVASPGFPNEPPHDDNYVRESDPEVDDAPYSLGAPHQLLVAIGPERALVRGRAAGEVPANKDPKALARFLVSTLHGVRVLARAGVDRAVLDDSVRTALEVLR